MQVAAYDTTLRDGSQREGVSLTIEDKLRIAKRLDDVGVAYIEGGFPASNPKDREFFEQASMLEFKNAKLVAFGITARKGVAAADDQGLLALAACAAPIVCIAGKTSVLHAVQTLGITPESNLKIISESIAFLRASGKEVMFDAEHYFDYFADDEQEREYKLEVLQTAWRAGASTLVLCDTNGGTLPTDVYDIITTTKSELTKRDAQDVRLAIHCHNDSGCAIAASLEAVRAGACQVQGTVGGYGERVGNCDLLATIANLELKMGVDVIGKENLQLLTPVYQFIAEIFNITPDAHAPYVGAAAFAHKGGLHVSALNRLHGAYEHIDPAAVGNLAHIVVSELSGKASLISKAQELGLDGEQVSMASNELLHKLKAMETEGYSFEVADASLALMIAKELDERPSFFTLETFRVIAEKRVDGCMITEATLKIEVDGQRFVTTAEGNGPVNALDNALRMALAQHYPQIDQLYLSDYKVRVLDESVGTGAVTRVLIQTNSAHSSFGTVGVSENVIEASWNALVDAITFGLANALDK